MVTVGNQALPPLQEAKNYNENIVFFRGVRIFRTAVYCLWTGG